MAYYNEHIAKKLLNASCEVFNCNTSKVCGYLDTEEKKQLFIFCIKCMTCVGFQLVSNFLYLICI